MGLKQSHVAKLHQEIWFPPIPDDEPDFKVLLRPAELADVQSLGGRIDALDFTDTVFVDFQGYEDDDGKPIPNSQEVRTQLFSALRIRNAITTRLWNLHGEFAKGEDSAVSDLQSGQSHGSDGDGEDTAPTEIGASE